MILFLYTYVCVCAACSVWGDQRECWMPWNNTHGVIDSCELSAGVLGTEYRSSAGADLYAAPWYKPFCLHWEQYFVPNHQIFKHLQLKKLLFLKCVYMGLVQFVYTRVMSEEVERGYWISWSQNYSWLWAAWHRYWELSLGSVETIYFLNHLSISPASNFLSH